MRRTSKLQIVVFALGLLLTQWLAVVHATRHELSGQPDQPSCPICAFAHAGGATPSTPLVPQAVEISRAPAVVGSERTPDPRSFYPLPPSRAPPRANPQNRS